MREIRWKKSLTGQTRLCIVRRAVIKVIVACGKDKRMEQFEKAVDSIRDKFGIDSIKRASFLQSDAIVDHAASKKKHLGD